jgi:hypothetical protein
MSDDLPEHFPGAWQNFPVEVRRYLTQRLLDEQLVLWGGSDGLIKHLYAGHDRDGLRPLDSYRMRGVDFWPFVLADTRAYLAKKREEAIREATA